MAIKLKNFNSHNLYGVNLSGLDLTEASFCNANLRRANFSNTRLDKADFTDADLTGANLAKAHLEGANFTDANLSWAKLPKSNLRNAILERACLEGANLEGTDLQNASIYNWKISDSTKINFLTRLPKISNGEINKSHQEIFDAEVGKSQQQWKKIDTSLDELYQLKKITNRETWNEHLSQKAQDLQLPLSIYNHMFNKYYQCRRFQESQHSLLVYLLRDFSFLKLERLIESLNYFIAHLDIFPILDKLQTLSIVGALVLLINQLITVNYESRYRAWEIINSDQTTNEKISGSNRLGLEILAKQSGSLERLQASGVELRGINLRNANLKNANFSEAKLGGANLRGSNLSGANLSGADLNAADLSEADLSWANLKNAEINEKTTIDPKWRLIWEIVNQNKVGRDLRGQDLSKADLRGANLREANLSGTDQSQNSSSLNSQKLFNQSDFNQRAANQRAANLRETNLSGADLREADLRGADLRGADLSKADLSWANLKNAQINEKTMLDDKWRLIWEIVNKGEVDRDLIGKDLSKANLSGANLSGANLSGANLSEADLSEGVKGLTVEQIRQAKNWQLAKFEPEFKKKLEQETK